jgi:hypothetical protein
VKFANAENGLIRLKTPLKRGGGHSHTHTHGVVENFVSAENGLIRRKNTLKTVQWGVALPIPTAL